MRPQQLSDNQCTYPSPGGLAGQLTRSCAAQNPATLIGHEHSAGRSTAAPNGGSAPRRPAATGAGGQYIASRLRAPAIFEADTETSALLALTCAERRFFAASSVCDGRADLPVRCCAGRGPNRFDGPC